VYQEEGSTREKSVPEERVFHEKEAVTGEFVYFEVV
jgi:hypothetical protein